ncbi:EAL domain-containing response regulator [Massilia rubra]|uniref:EAL domain-containing response regulator n=1 Tax=Massilia rubra TaxID=2607910 RepID=A0ABX0LE57_9BURK|nr:EAL domain-containing response regulator [Massilia rubra]
MSTPAFSTVKLRVLVVDDDPLHCALMLALLRRLGVSQPLAASDGAAGLAVLADNPRAFDLVIADLNMPGMDGMAFVRRASALSACRFALSSAFGSGVLACAMEAAQEHGLAMAGVLPKPVEAARLASLLDMARASAAPAAAPRVRWSRPQLARALGAGQFEPYFQPQCALLGGACRQVEMLARWRHPQLGMLGPEHFIAAMEEDDLLDSLTDHLLGKALAWLARWQAGGIALRVALNVSPRSAQHHDFADRMLALARTYGIATQRITLELTETALAGCAADLLDSVVRLRMHGFELAIDDFGVGYSSLQRIAALPVTELKIDRSFVRAAGASDKGLLILCSITELAANLGLRAVAEGIETAADAELLHALGCAIGQGFFLAPPMAGPALAPWYRQRPGLHKAAGLGVK